MKRSFMFICAAALLLTGCGASADEASAQLFAMDTVMQLDAYGHQVKQAVSDAEETIQALEARLSRTREDSLVSVLNQNGAAQDLSAAEQALLSEALTFRDATGGAFDITIAPVMDAWGFTGDSYRVPAQDELDALLENVNSDEIRLSGSSVTLGARQAIDLGGIAKGYIADQVAALVRGRCSGAMLNFGGNVYAVGTKPDGSAYRVGVQDPDDPNNSSPIGAFSVIDPSAVTSGPIGVVSVIDRSVVTSGIYERGFTIDGVRYHHILSPWTGLPSDSDLASATIIAESSMDADALATACIVLGSEKALQLTQENGYPALMILRDGTVMMNDLMKQWGYTSLR